MTLDYLIEMDMEETIEKECETWACWDEMSEMEKDETFNAYMVIAKKAAKLGYDFAKASGETK